MILNEILQKLDNAYQQNKPFVIYRKPNEDIVNALFQVNDKLLFLEDFSKSGFVFAPFNNKNKAVLFSFDKCKSFKVKIKDHVAVVIKEENDISTEIENTDFDKKKHIKLVKSGVNFIKNGGALKVVLSRKEEIELKNYDIGLIFKELIQKYSSEFVYVWFHPKVGLWMGASPENLLKISDKKFTTMALAGTQIFMGNTNVIWGEKEKQEQQFVTDFIVSQLKKNDIKTSKPFTLKAGNLLHICTEIEGRITDDINLEDLINNLHPTPAVCGLPKETAKNFILENEDYDREFYTGFLGELNNESIEGVKESDLYVNLRCMQIKGHKIIIYIGGGITKDSNPENEWEETVAKSKVIKKALDNN